MYSGFGSRLHRPSGFDASMQMKNRFSINRRVGAGGKGPWNKSNRARSMRRGRGRGFQKSPQSLEGREMSFGTIHEGTSFLTIKEEPGIGVGKLRNSRQSIHPSSVGSTKKARRSLLPTPMKAEPGIGMMAEQQNSRQSEDSGTTPGIMQEAQSLLQPIKDEPGVERNECNSLGGVLLPSSKISSSDSSTKAAHNNQKSKEPTSKEAADVTQPKLTFICNDCNVTCTSEVSFNEHLVGKKHKTLQEDKKQKKAIRVAIRNNAHQPLPDFGVSKVLRKTTPLPGTSMQKVFMLLCETEDVVGMQYITEYRKLGTTHCRYMCELCDYVCNMEEMVEHLICRRHRLRYARTHLFSAYARMTDYPSFQNMMLPTHLDKFLARVCARVINADIARGMRSCRTKQYINESDIGIDVSLFSRIGKQHPSTLEDLVIAESILEEADAIGQSSQRQPQRLTGSSSLRRGNILTELSDLDAVEPRIRKNTIIPNQNMNQSSIIFMEKKKQSILQSLEANSRSIKLYGLTIAGAKERDGLLKRLKATNCKIQELRAITQHSPEFGSEYQEAENSSTVAPRLPNRRREHPVYEEIPPKRMKDEADQNANLSDSLAEIQKAVEPIIAETRRRVEQKIYEAMESGNLPSVLNALKKNPNLHDTLQKWQKDQQTQEDAGPSQRRPGHSEGHGYPEYSDESPLNGGSNFRFDNPNFSHQLHDTDFPGERGLPIHSIRRHGLLGSRPSLGLDSASLSNHRYNGAGW